MGRETDRRVLETLDEWEKDSLPAPVELHARLIRIQTEAKATIDVHSHGQSRETISERLRSGVPALAFDDLQLDWAKVESLFARALSVIGEYVATGAIGEARPLPQMARAWYEGDPVPDEEGPLYLGLCTAIAPFLAKQAEELLPSVDQGLWRRGYCPICGGTPHLAVLRGDEGARELLCSRCGSEWRFQRLECPFCGTREQRRLAYFSDESGLHRLYVCEECKGYIKAVDLRKSGSEVLLPLEWIGTLDMDRQAQDMGYRAGEVNMRTDSGEAR